MNRNHTENAEGCVVGIGASAGGLEALQKLLNALPPDTGFPYVIVQHLSPDYKSLLREILSKYTQMPVTQVEDGMPLEPNHVYVIQPGKNMRLHKGRLFLVEQNQTGLNLPIDLFFRSLAQEAGPRAIAIILSGTGSDGANGIRDIKENDGMIIVQDLDSSKFDGMPRSAMRTGLVDAQITPEQIALELKHISQAMGKNASPAKADAPLDHALMQKIFAILRKASNVNFAHYKPSTIQRRIERRMMLTHRENMQAYVDMLIASPEEVKTLSREVLIGVTSFFRDPEAYQSLKEKIIPAILTRNPPEEGVRVWVAGCSTGEEAYSIAILFMEVMEERKLARSVKIFATDLDMESIQTAGRGAYGDSIAEAVSPLRLSRYFTRRSNTYTVNREIRKMIVFSPHNVFQDPPFGRLDLISCRNMLIYFQNILQNELFGVFHASLRNGGYLFLGKSEAVGAYTEAFTLVDSTARIYQHKEGVRVPGQKMPLYFTAARMEDDAPADTAALYAQAEPASGMQSAQDGIDQKILEQYLPPCLVFNEKNELLHTYGDVANYVHMPLGRFSRNVFDLLSEGLKIPVSTLLKQARETKSRAQYKDIHFEGEVKSAVAHMTIAPVGLSHTEPLYALVLNERGDDAQYDSAASYDVNRVASQRIVDLEADLSVTQEKLKRSVAEQECVNEELQAANEELLTANEELQSSNEELQSVNEELYTVNAEFQTKLVEMADLNDDIANFLASTLIGIIFVDNKLNLRRYTNYVTTEFSVMDHDIGRSLKFISYHFPTADIAEICNGVLKTLVPDERELTTGSGKVFFVRVAPYRSTENKILGCVITLVDITGQKLGMAQLQSTEERLTIAQKSSDDQRDQLARVLSEIRAPIRALEALSNEALAQSGQSPALDETLNRIARTASFIASVVSTAAPAETPSPVDA